MYNENVYRFKLRSAELGGLFEQKFQLYDFVFVRTPLLASVDTDESDEIKFRLIEIRRFENRQRSL